MTYEERKQQVCKDCPINRLSCSYRNRGLENKCLDLQTIMGGWELGHEDAIDKACEWLKANICKRLYVYDGEAGFPTAEFLKDFRKAMED